MYKAKPQARPEAADCYHFHLEEQSGESLKVSEFLNLCLSSVLSLWMQWITLCADFAISFERLFKITQNMAEGRLLT